MTDGINVVGPLDTTTAWDGQALYTDADVRAGAAPPPRLRGAAGVAQALPSGGVRLFRDPLGIGKLFWARATGGSLDVAARPARLVDRGHPFEAIAPFPRGVSYETAPDTDEETSSHFLAPSFSGMDSSSAPWELETIARNIRSELDDYLAALAGTFGDRPAFVCLSGGLDSSAIAVLAREHFPHMVGVSFDLRAHGGGPSEDRIAAQRLAADLGIDLLEASVTSAELLEWLDLVLVEGVDWREFNVHAGLVNAALAARIAEASPGDSRPLVLTGDLANEFLVDYSAEVYEGKTYYAMPRLQPAALRAALVSGLDTSHREVGIFEAWDQTVVQPYAVALDSYLAIPPELLLAEERKGELVRAMLGSRLPGYIYERPKMRAQVGGAELGGSVLAACVDRGMDGDWLRQRFAALHRIDDDRVLNQFIRAGRYRATVPQGGQHAAT